MLCFGTSCTISNEVAIPVTQLGGKPIDIDTSNVLCYPMQIVGDIAVSGSAFPPRRYYASYFGLDGFKKSEPLFNVGHGHNEFENISFSKGDNNTWYLLDGNPKRFIVKIPNVKYIEDLRNTSRWQKYDLKQLEPFRSVANNFYPMSDSTILIPGSPYKYIGHILSILDYKNQKCTPLEYWPDDGIEIDSLPKHSIYTNNCKVYGNGKGHYMYLSYYRRFAFIFSIKGNKVNVIKNLYTSYPKYDTKDHLNYICYKVSPKGLKCATNNKNVFLLLTDADRTGTKLELKNWDRQDVYGNKLEIYDWDGNLQKRILLDHFGQRIMVSDDNKKLYLFSDDQYEGEINPEIWTYDIDKL